MNCVSHCCSQFISLQKEISSHFTPEIVFYGLEEDGIISVLEYHTQFPLSSLYSNHNHNNNNHHNKNILLSLPLEIYFRPKQLFENERNRIEVIEKETQEIISSYSINEENNSNSIILNEISHLIVSSNEVREDSIQSLILRIYLFNQQPNSSFLNVIYFPLEQESSLSKHISEKSEKSFYCFVLDSDISIRVASISEGFVSQIDKVIYEYFIIYLFIFSSSQSHSILFNNYYYYYLIYRLKILQL